VINPKSNGLFDVETDAYFLARLTGTSVTNSTTTSRKFIMNLEADEWDEELCSLLGIPLDFLSEIQPTVRGFYCAGASPITASVVYTQAPPYGHGCCKKGDRKITFGTDAFALALTGDSSNASMIFEPRRNASTVIEWCERFTEAVSR
jgi:glycerol kinase